MGSIYAALLAHAGHDVRVIDAWPAHIDAINRSGLRVEGASGDRTVRVAASTQIPQAPVDLVVVAVKAAHVPGVAPDLRRLMSGDTVVLTIQNGVGSADIVAGHVHPDRLCIGIAGGFGALMRGPGHAYHNGMNAIRVGPHAGLPAAAVERLVGILREAGFNAESVANVEAMQWEKLICNVAYSAPCALTGMTVGEVLDDPDMGPISRTAATEAWTVARRLGIAINVDDPVRFVRDFGAAIPAAKPSLLQDHEHQRSSEIDVINGAVTRAAAKLGLEVPVNTTLVALVKIRERSFPRAV
jgi:2-dehydropantoate 2-reductase